MLTAYVLLVILVFSIVFLYGYIRVENLLMKEAYEMLPTHIQIEHLFMENQDSDNIIDILRDIPVGNEFVSVNNNDAKSSAFYYNTNTEYKKNYIYQGVDAILVPLLNKFLMNSKLENVYNIYSQENIGIQIGEGEGRAFLRIDHHIESDLFTGDITLYRVVSTTLLDEFKTILSHCLFFFAILSMMIFINLKLMRKLYYGPLDKMRKHFLGMTKFNMKVFTYDGPMIPKVRNTIDVVNQTVLELQDGVQESKAFLDEMVHEIKNPAHNIKNEIELIEDTITIDDEELKKNLYSVVNETENITSLLSSIKVTYDIYYLGGSPPDSWIKPIVEIEPIYIEYQSKYPEWTFSFEHCVNPNRLIWIDKGSIELIIRNLLDNAIKYSKEGASIFIGIREQQDEENRILIDVVNTNSSIEYHKMGKIFDKYYRTNKAKEQTVGAGIGLWLIKNLTDIYDADVSVQSSKETTGFIISFKHIKEMEK